VDATLPSSLPSMSVSLRSMSDSVM
jgi:hypothetical protein